MQLYTGYNGPTRVSLLSYALLNICCDLLTRLLSLSSVVVVGEQHLTAMALTPLRLTDSRLRRPASIVC